MNLINTKSAYNNENENNNFSHVESTCEAKVATMPNDQGEVTTTYSMTTMCTFDGEAVSPTAFGENPSTTTVTEFDGEYIEPGGTTNDPITTEADGEYIEPGGTTNDPTTTETDGEYIEQSGGTDSAATTTGPADGEMVTPIEPDDGVSTTTTTTTAYPSAPENILITSIRFLDDALRLGTGDTQALVEEILPANATNRHLRYTSSNPSVATVDPDSGLVTAIGEGEATITAYAQDGSEKTAACAVTVFLRIPVTSIKICADAQQLLVGDTCQLTVKVYPENATNKQFHWTFNDESLVTVGAPSCILEAKNAGAVVITVTTIDGGYSDSCEIWIKGKTPVFLIHGRTSNSTVVWGINNSIPESENNEYDSDINALSLNDKKYIDVTSQTLLSFESNNGDNDADYPCNLGNRLIDAGYKENVNLFAFNYPNQDAVKYSAQKFEAYIDNLISIVRNSNNNELKACFYASKYDYDSNNYKISIVGHSMGGLVARYFIENLHQDSHVDKLITICTPHWGSGYANISNRIAINHELCDHDLNKNSAMYGGTASINLNCTSLGADSCQQDYTLTDELLYDRARQTKYYAIVGIDYPAGPIVQNDYGFEMSNNYTTYKQIDNFMVGKMVYRYQPSDFNAINVGDNMVGFMSQIGWTENSGNEPDKRIQMEKIFIDVDTDGGNGGGVFILELINGLGSEIFHNKAPHRMPVCNKIVEYLED